MEQNGDGRSEESGRESGDEEAAGGRPREGFEGRGLWGTPDSQPRLEAGAAGLAQEARGEIEGP